MPTDRNVYVEYQDLERANQAMAEEREEEPAPPEEDEMPKGKRMVIQTVSIIAFLALVMLAVLATDQIAAFLKNLVMP